MKNPNTSFFHNCNFMEVAKVTKLRNGEVIVERLTANKKEWVTVPGNWTNDKLERLSDKLMKEHGVPKWNEFWKPIASWR